MSAEAFLRKQLFRQNFEQNPPVLNRSIPDCPQEPGWSSGTDPAGSPLLGRWA